MTKLDHALALAKQGFYVFPIVENRKAPPRMEGWQRYATREPNKVADLWRAHPNDNIGISTSRFGDREALLVVDVDNKEGKDGDAELLRLELDGLDFTPTLENRTPTGGRHLVYRCVRAVRQGANVLGSGIDIRSRGGYIVGPGSTIDGVEYTAGDQPVACAPEWLVARCGQPRERAERTDGFAGPAPQSALERAKHYLLREAPTEDDPDAYKVAARVKDFGVDLETCIELMREHWDPRCDPPRTDNTVDPARNAYRYGLDPAGVAAPERAFTPVVSASVETAAPTESAHPFTILNREYAFVVAGGGSHILHITRDAYDRPEIKHLDKNTFHDKHAAWEMQCGKKSAQVTKLWMCSPDRRSYDGLVFDPARGGDVVQAERKYFNLWRGFAVEPLAPEESVSQEAANAVDKFFEHARDNVCGGDDQLYGWLIGYFAHLLQRPWEKPLVALVFRGGKGVGKNALVERMGALLGSHFLLSSNRRYLVGNFNGHLENCLMFALDEAFWSGDKAAEGLIKDLITGNEHVIEHKGKEPFRVANRTRVVIIGNEEWLVPASHDERRFAVFDVGDGRKQDRAYFESMRLGMERGGYRLLARRLLGTPCSEVNAAPLTKGLRDQKRHSLEAFERWWLDCLMGGRIAGSDFEGWPSPQAHCDRFRAAYRRYARDNRLGNWVLSDTEIGKWLRKVCPSARPSKMREGEAMLNSYKLPPLEDARRAWEARTGHAEEWDQ